MALSPWFPGKVRGSRSLAALAMALSASLLCVPATAVPVLGEDVVAPGPAATPAVPAVPAAQPTADPAAVPSAPADPAQAATATPASRREVRAQKKAKRKRSKETSRALPRAGSPAASQRYAKAYIAARYGWGAGQFSCLKAMWIKESQWKYWVSNPNGRYHGIPQTSRHEWSKDGYSTGQYMNSPAIQIKVGTRYIKSRYGSPCSAWAFWRSHHWY